MKRFKKLFSVLIVICAVLVPSIVKAEGTDLKLSCGDAYAEKEEGVSCSLSLETSDTFKSISFKLDKELVGEKAVIESMDDDIVIAGDFEGGFTITKKNNGTISDGTLLFINDITMPSIDKATYDKKLGQYKYDIKLIGAKFVNTSDKTITGYDAKATVRLLSTDKTLSSITIDGAGLTGFNPKATQYKYTTSNAKINFTAIAGNQKAEINGKLKEVKDVEKTLSYGETNLTITVISEYGNYLLDNDSIETDEISKYSNTYVIKIFRYYRLFPGYDFEFNSKEGSYTLSVGNDITKFAICKNGENDIFVKKAGVLCINTEVLADVYGYTNESQQTTYYKTLKLNGTYVTADWESLSAKEKFDRWEPITDENGNQTEYQILADLKDGANTLTFSVDDTHPEYKITINKGEKSDLLEGGSTNGGDTPGIGGAVEDTDNKNDNVVDNNNDNKTEDKKDETVKDETVESPKTGIITYTAIILAVAGLAGGAYYYLRKKNIIKKI